MQRFTSWRHWLPCFDEGNSELLKSISRVLSSLLFVCPSHLYMSPLTRGGRFSFHPQSEKGNLKLLFYLVHHCWPRTEDPHLVRNDFTVKDFNLPSHSQQHLHQAQGWMRQIISHLQVEIETEYSRSTCCQQTEERIQQRYQGIEMGVSLVFLLPSYGILKKTLCIFRP